ncbi:FAD-dependent oxidoreductase [Hoeflea sp.]|uniref:FAD-dependent oxidoreductase n=1 Tax=Hoeflea sp. TaxID=1940281 RepID=UPI003BAFD24E
MPAQDVHIIGAGIAGLTAALALSRQGRDVRIIDQAPELSEVGAGLQMSPNASRILISLGLGEALDRALLRPARISLVSGHSLRKIAHVPCGGFAEQRWGAPYGVLHRADLQVMLLAAVRADPRCHLELGTRTASADVKTLADRDGAPSNPLVIGADGVWSQVRELVPDAARPQFSGQVAWRFVMAADQARPLLDTTNVSVFLAPHTHLVAYPLAGGELVNMVAIARGSDPGKTWAAAERPADRQALLRDFADWHPKITGLLRDVPEMSWWPLFSMPDGRWFDDRNIVLIGDAAHAMTPFAAQGAALAIEDGYELALAVCAEETGPAASLGSFERSRRARIAKARSRAAFNRFAYHARGPIRLGRDVVLGLRRPESLAADLDWLYGYRSPGT